ncbi:hypothetical protein [Dyadobacter pollutisoli]|jgi:hypothetical protein|uniref:Uncharacterized protein n=1 Tax=Dyadobacter pollutisoli TaxID=2910158 RepID=A0A9E8SNN4_9BACT|nr:hypothetical protein [Dyadobacter pollutisoli]WAC10952.1 hypothetical protein ON006_24795 [Dyadobacter pollutisoli]
MRKFLCVPAIWKGLLYILLMLKFMSFSAFGQLVETNKVNTKTSEVQPGSSFLSTASFAFAGTAPSASIKTYKLTAYIGESPWNFYFYNTVPLYVSNREDSTRAFANDLLNQLGGLLNVSLAKVAYFANGGDVMNKDIKGAQLDFRFGSKVMDKQYKNDKQAISSYLIPSLQGSLDFRYLIPLVKSKAAATGTALRDNIAGNLSFRIFGTFQQILNRKQFEVAFKTPRGNVPPNQIITGNFEANLFISNEIFISAGYAYSNLIQPANLKVNKDRTFFSVSFLPNLNK